MPKSTDALDHLRRQAAAVPELTRMVEEARVNGQVADLVYKARQRAGLTQSQLAKLVATSQSVIARLEDPDCLGHSLTMLRRVAQALHVPLVLTLGDETRELQHL